MSSRILTLERRRRRDPMPWSSVLLVIASMLAACVPAESPAPTPSMSSPAPTGAVRDTLPSGSTLSPIAQPRPVSVTGYPAAGAGTVLLIIGSELIRYDSTTGEARAIGTGAQFATTSSVGAYVVPGGGPASRVRWNGAKDVLDCGILLRRVSISASGDCAGIRGDLSLTIQQGGDASRLVIPPGGGAIDVAWSPDGRELALIRRADQFENALWIIRPDGSGMELYRAPRGSNGDTLWWPTWSPDGSTIAVVLNRFGSFSLGADAGVSLLLIARAGGQVVDLGIVPLTPDRIRWSATGALAFARGAGREPARKREVVVRGSDGAEAVIATPLGDHPAWGADGRRLAFSEPDGTATRITVADLTSFTRTSLRCPTGDATAARWSADGGRLLILCHERGSEESELWLHTIGGRTARLLTVGTRSLIDLFDHVAWSEAAR